MVVAGELILGIAVATVLRQQEKNPSSPLLGCVGSTAQYPEEASGQRPSD